MQDTTSDMFAKKSKQTNATPAALRGCSEGATFLNQTMNSCGSKNR